MYVACINILSSLSLTHPSAMEHSATCAQSVRFDTERIYFLTNHLTYSCLLPIVGALFHCAICESVDICSNCEAAGLPGNLDSEEGGHDSSHILLKVRLQKFDLD